MTKHFKKKALNGPRRAALYLRVSSGAQAQRELSIPDQRRQLIQYCDAQGWSLTKEFQDARTGTDDKRPDFRRMMDIACHGDAPFDVIVVHSYSRFFRDEVESELHIRSLAKRGIQLVSITQEFEDSPLGEMVRRIMALFDEYDSKETGKHVSRALAENARQGFFSGGTPPYGFEAVEVEKRGNTSKKKLVPKAGQDEIVRLMFELYRTGDGSSGPLGVKKVTEWLNDHGYRTRGGAKWGIGQLHRILTDPVYKGDYQRRNNGADAETEIIHIPVPPIIPAATFDAVQRDLSARNPMKTPPRTVSGPILLSGLAICASCGSAMTISTGKSGQYKYYACGGRMRQGKGTCAGRRVRMKEVDELVIEAIMADMMTPPRMTKLFQALCTRQTASDAKKTARLSKYQDALNDATTALSRLMQLVANGTMEASDPALAEQIATYKNQRDNAQSAVDAALAELAPAAKITEEKISEFVQMMRKNLSHGDVQFRRAYLRAVIDTVEIDKTQIRITGRTSQLEQAVLRQDTMPVSVPTFVRGWRRDRN